MSYDNPRIKSLDLSVLEIIAIMTDCNIGATNVCMQIMTETPKIDPDNLLQGLGIILSLDTHDIYGSRIWMFYKDVCGENINRMLGVLRAVNMGFETEGNLHRAIDTGNPKFDVDALLKRVKERLPAFQIEKV